MLIPKLFGYRDRKLTPGTSSESVLSFTAAFSSRIRLDFLVREMSLHPSDALNPVKGLALVNSPVAAEYLVAGETQRCSPVQLLTERPEASTLFYSLLP